MKIVIVGSLSLQKEMEVIANIQKKLGHNVVFPKQSDRPLIDIIEDFYTYINEANLVIAVPKKDGTFGDGVRYEIAFANWTGTPVIIYDTILRSDMKGPEK